MAVVVPDVVELMDREADKSRHKQQDEDFGNVQGRHTYALLTKY